jgi:hypothetical protein
MKILIILGLISLFLYIILTEEKFTMYAQNPFKYNKIGTTPLSYYPKPRYRLPYRYPFKYSSSYPINHTRFI